MNDETLRRAAAILRLDAGMLINLCGGMQGRIREEVDAKVGERRNLADELDLMASRLVTVVDTKKCTTCNGHGLIGGNMGQTAGNFEQCGEPCPDCNA